MQQFFTQEVQHFSLLFAFYFQYKTYIPPCKISSFNVQLKCKTFSRNYSGFIFFIEFLFFILNPFQFYVYCRIIGFQVCGIGGALNTFEYWVSVPEDSIQSFIIHYILVLTRNFFLFSFYLLHSSVNLISLLWNANIVLSTTFERVLRSSEKSKREIIKKNLKNPSFTLGCSCGRLPSTPRTRKKIRWRLITKFIIILFYFSRYKINSLWFEVNNTMISVS